MHELPAPVEKEVIRIDRGEQVALLQPLERDPFSQVPGSVPRELGAQDPVGFHVPAPTLLQDEVDAFPDVFRHGDPGPLAEPLEPLHLLLGEVDSGRDLLAHHASSLIPTRT